MTGIFFYDRIRINGIVKTSELLPQNSECASEMGSLAYILDMYMQNGYNQAMIKSFADKETEKIYNQVFSKKMPQVILKHGLADPLLPYLQSVQFFNRAIETGNAEKVSLHLEAGKVHADSWFFAYEQVAALFPEVTDESFPEDN